VRDHWSGIAAPALVIGVICEVKSMTPVEMPQCPRCGSESVSVCGQSMEYGPEEWPDQPLRERKLHTIAYQCECGMAFTHTQRGDDPH
jgi:hypothetical protein